MSELTLFLAYVAARNEIDKRREQFRRGSKKQKRAWDSRRYLWLLRFARKLESRIVEQLSGS